MTRIRLREVGLYVAAALLLGMLHSTLMSLFSMPHSVHQFVLRAAVTSGVYGALLVLPSRRRAAPDPADPQQWLTADESGRAAQLSR
jgi:hypothetical protein